MDDDTVKSIIYLADILESCDFALFWLKVGMNDFVSNITGFYDSIRKFICHVVGITFQTIEKDYLVRLLGDIDGMHNLFSHQVSVCNPKNKMFFL